MMTELQILERIAATTEDPNIRVKTENLIKALKDHKARLDGRQARGGLGDRVIVEVQRGGTKSLN